MAIPQKYQSGKFVSGCSFKKALRKRRMKVRLYLECDQDDFCFKTLLPDDKGQCGIYTTKWHTVQNCCSKR